MGQQRPAARLAAGVGAQLSVKREKLGFEAVDHRQGDVDLAPGRLGQVEGLEPGAVLGREKAAALRGAVVVELGLDPLLPLAALLAQGVAQAHHGAQLEDVGRRDPGLRQPALLQQFAQMPGVGAV